MIVKNKVEESILRYDGIPDACRGSAWQLMSPFYALKAKQEDPAQLYYVRYPRIFNSRSIEIIREAKQVRESNRERYTSDLSKSRVLQ
jgi:hypothetical protein